MINLTYMNGFDDIRALFVGVISAIISFFSPITDYVFALTIVFFANFWAGLITDIISGNNFSFKKFKSCIIETTVYFLLIFGIYSVGHFTHKPEGAIQCASGVMFVIIYYYATNIFRNLTILIPNSKPISLIYYVLSFEILQKYPILKRFSEKVEKDNENDITT